MIEQMNKYLFVVYHKEYEEFLKQLRELGVVHIKETKDKRKIAELEDKLQHRKLVDQLYKKVKSRREKGAPAIEEVQPSSETEAQALQEWVEKQFAWEQELTNQLASSERELAYWEIWGEVDILQLEKLRQEGYPVRFFVSPTASYKTTWEEEFNATLINTERAHNYFITVGDFGGKHPDAEEIKAPMKSLDALRERVETFRKELERVQKEITQFANERIGELMGILSFIDRSYAFSNALLQATLMADSSVKVLEGWVPTASATAFEAEVEQLPVYYERLAIGEQDDVPVKLKNNSFARLFEPITKMYSLPNYHELDITGLFAPFFMLFFALCFGDGGYGLLLFTIATIVRMRAKKQSAKDIAGMLQWLGGTAAVVGSLMGTVFGMVMPWAGDDGVLGSVREDYFLNQNNLMTLSIVLGFIQIIFGKFVAGAKRARQRGFKYGLSMMAWGLFILTAMLGLVSQQVFPTSTTLHYILYGIAGVSILVAFFYNSPDKNILVNFGSGLWDTYGTATGILGDVLSYIRLFAIGLTGGILGGVFNTLAYDISSGLPMGLNFIVMSLILLFGHSLNIGLAMISSFVHPLRLTFVEFYKNAEFEGGGKQYNPLN